MAVTRRRLLLSLLPSFVLLAACGGDSDGSPLAQPSSAATRLPALVITRPPPTPTQTPAPTITPVPSPTPTATPLPPPVLAANDAIVIGGEVRTRSQASTTAEQVGTLADKSKVQIAQRIQGENWL